jgi:hypothetical protein
LTVKLVELLTLPLLVAQLTQVPGKLATRVSTPAGVILNAATRVSANLARLEFLVWRWIQFMEVSPGKT